jgi:hypothetical protein
VLEMAMGKRVRGCLVLSGLFCKSQGRGGRGSGEGRRWWRPRFSLFFFFAKGGGSRRERNQFRFRVLLLLFSLSKFFSASPL